jgi:hypothetical protein
MIYFVANISFFIFLQNFFEKETKMLVSVRGWHNGLETLKNALNTETWTMWTEEQINRLPLWQVIKLCQDRKAWHKDLLRPPAPSTRVCLNRDSIFKQIIYVNEHTFLFIPKHGYTRRVTPSASGDLIGIGHLSPKEYRRIRLETWLNLAKHVLMGINGDDNENSRYVHNHGSIHHWVSGHWRRLSAGRNAYKISPLGEDLRHFGLTWVDQYHVHRNDGAVCTMCKDS